MTQHTSILIQDIMHNLNQPVMNGISFGFAFLISINLNDDPAVLRIVDISSGKGEKRL